MTSAHRIQIRLSECRQRLNELLQTETRDAGQQTELETLTTEVAKLEPELRAAIAAEPDPEVRTAATGDPETRERLALRSRSCVAGYLRAVVEGRAVDGAEAEYAAAEGVAGFGRIPMAIFRPVETRAAVEVRAITPGPAVDGPAQPAIPYVFQRSALADLGVLMPSVPPGVTQIPRITAAPPADPLRQGCGGAGYGRVRDPRRAIAQAHRRAIRGTRRGSGGLARSGVGAIRGDPRRPERRA